MTKQEWGYPEGSEDYVDPLLSRASVLIGKKGERTKDEEAEFIEIKRKLKAVYIPRPEKCLRCILRESSSGIYGAKFCEEGHMIEVLVDEKNDKWEKDYSGCDKFKPIGE